nr:type IV pilus modification protein PilV [Ectothiorhodospira haloalkaliphila]
MSLRATGSARAAIRSAHSGFTLIEVLVAVVVLSIGLIGLASLQGTALKANHSAYMRAQATLIAQEMLDVMRVDRVAARQQSYDGTFSAPPAATGELPDDELNRWVTNLQNRLPSASAQISTVSSTAVVTISVTWDDSRGEESPETFTLRTGL